MESCEIREELNAKQKEYDEKLLSYSHESIERAVKVLMKRRERVKQNVGRIEEDLDEETQKVFELMEQYAQEIKQIFIRHGESITHITGVAPEKMAGGKIAKSVNRANNYETERGSWVFASSNPMDGKNPYVARSLRGMILIARGIHIYGEDNMQVEKNEQGETHVVLKQPNYMYKINPEKFMPVVTLIKDNESNPHFEFSEEWISETEVDINDPMQVRGIEEIRDVTNLIENYQVLCDVNQSSEAVQIRQSSSKEEAIQRFLLAIREGRLRYINGEAGININQQIEDERLFAVFEEKLAHREGHSIEEFRKLFDKKIITSGTNKDGEKIYILRKKASTEIAAGQFQNRGRYLMYTKDAQYAGFVDVTVSNSNKANKAEIEYKTAEEQRNRGNMTIALEEVLKDVFVDCAYDNLTIKDIFPKTQINEVFLSIAQDNYASQAVARKSGFEQKDDTFTMTKERFLQMIHGKEIESETEGVSAPEEKDSEKKQTPGEEPEF